MQRDEIIEMARQAAAVNGTIISAGFDGEFLEAFAKLVAAKEQDRICRQIAALHDSIMLASHATLTKRGESNEDK
jgi:hypothetical protein